MFRLTVGRRLALAVAIALGAVLILLLVARSGLETAALDRSNEQMTAIAGPLASAIESELNLASELLEVTATQVDADSTSSSVSENLDDRGFIAAELLETGEESELGATQNFRVRAQSGPTIGGTFIFGVNGSVGVLLGTSVAATGEILVAAYDVSGILVAVSGASVGESTEALLAVRDSDGAPRIFSPSRHNDDQPIGNPDAPTTALLNEVLSVEDTINSTDQVLNGRRSVVTAQRIAGVEWALVIATDRSEVASSILPVWLLPGIIAIALLTLVPIAMLRSRLQTVTRGAQDLSRGRLQTPLNDSSTDEIGVLSRTLKSLDGRLQAEESKRSRATTSLEHQATHDPLTGLANRGKFVEELTETLNDRDSAALLFCDIDNFKGINDTHGHEAGDAVLKFVANQLGSVCGPNELIARFGGDEFCVLSKTTGQGARHLAGKVERALDTTVVVHDNQLRIGGSVGLAIAKVTDTPDSLLNSADLAMYREKERRRGLRNSAQGGVDDHEVSLEQIRLVYQPVVDINDGQILGVEVLARYMHPVLGMLDPSSFLPPGTEPGMFDQFDLEILTRSIAQLGEWFSAGIVDERFTMSVNLKPDHVSDSDSTRKIFDILRQHRVPAAMLQIEVTEHRLHTHEDDLSNSLHRLRERGIKVAIDDFGVEGSNMDRLLQIPCDTVKIDRSFVSEIDVDERAQARLKAMLEIVGTESLTPIAEGVERKTQAEILQEFGVRLGQGFLWHAPISALALTPLLGRASRWTKQRPSTTGS